VQDKGSCKELCTGTTQAQFFIGAFFMLNTYFQNTNKLLNLMQQSAPKFYDSHIAKRIHTLTSDIDSLRVKYTHATFQEKHTIKANGLRLKQELEVYKNRGSVTRLSNEPTIQNTTETHDDI